MGAKQFKSITIESKIMKTQKVKCLGVEVSKSVPSTMEELGKIGLNQEQVVDTAVKHIMYHVFLGDVRDAVQKAIEEECGFERPFEYAKNAKGEETKAKKYTQTVEKWLEELVGAGELEKSAIADVVKNCVADTEFKATSPREKKDVDLERRLGLVKAMKAKAPTDWKEQFAKKCERNEVEPLSNEEADDDNAVAAKILEIELAP